MAEFTPIPRPNSNKYAGEIFEPWPEGDSSLLTCPPNPGLFIQEARYWDEKYAALTALNDPSTNTTNLRHQSRALRQIFNGFNTYNVDVFTDPDVHVFITTTALLGISRYLRNDPAFDFAVPHHNILSINDEMPWRNALHLPLADLLHRDLRRPQKNQPAYYESEDLFIQVVTPAVVNDGTDHFVGFEREHPYMVLSGEYATVVPRPKWCLWAGFELSDPV